MRNLLLSAALIAIPVAAFSLVETGLHSAPQQARGGLGLGDLSAYSTIVASTRAIAKSGDFVAAERRITDLETLWDDNASQLRKADPVAWGAVDGAADQAFSALRAGNPDPANINTALANLQQVLAAPEPQTTGSTQQVAGIDVTDASGHPVPCEEMIGQVRAKVAQNAAPPAVADLQAKAVERCNADDDVHADAFAAQALAQLSK